MAKLAMRLYITLAMIFFLLIVTFSFNTELLVWRVATWGLITSLTPLALLALFSVLCLIWQKGE